MISELVREEDALHTGAAALPELQTAVQQTESARSPLATAIVYGAITGLLLLLGWGLVKVQGGQVDTGMAPDFTLTSFETETIALSEMRGQMAVINFLAFWCAPCREEAPYLEGK